MATRFDDFFRTGTEHFPYNFQTQLGEAEVLPSLITAPTGGGKTEAAVLPWLFQRTVAHNPDTPRRLVYVLPPRRLLGTLMARIAGWLERLGLTGEIGLHRIDDGVWRRSPERTAILVTTSDLALSRALMRGWGDSSTMAPVSFGLLHNDTQWVFDEAELLGPGLETSRRLQQMRDEVGTFTATRSTWMSSLGGGAAGEADSVRRFHRAIGDDPAAVAWAAREAHVPDTRTLVVLNSVARAREVAHWLRDSGADAMLLHESFRARDLRAVEGSDFVVTTQAIEAGTDVTCRTLLTELTSWASLVQRAGRCNRDGSLESGGDVLWFAAPGEHAAADPVADWLTAHEGRAVSASELMEADVAGPRAEAGKPLEPDDLVRLFDTVGEVDGVADRVCAPVDRTVHVAWRIWGNGQPPADAPEPGRNELCAVALDGIRALEPTHVWLRDRVNGGWRCATADDHELTAGVPVLLDASRGGYRPDEGWAPDSLFSVNCPDAVRAPRTFACVHWVGLDQHLMETEEEARTLLGKLGELPGDLGEIVARAARHHDLGKSHAVFQDMLRDGGGEPPAGLLAKSAAPWSNGVSAREHFRHDFASALILTAQADWQPLPTYLVAAHHGRVRVTVRQAPGEDGTFLGVRDGDVTPHMRLSNGEEFPATVLDTSPFRPGGVWTGAVGELVAAADLGPFRLAYLETLVRVSDWRSSARHDGPVTA